MIDPLIRLLCIACNPLGVSAQLQQLRASELASTAHAIRLPHEKEATQAQDACALLEAGEHTGDLMPLQLQPMHICVPLQESNFLHLTLTCADGVVQHCALAALMQLVVIRAPLHIDEFFRDFLRLFLHEFCELPVGERRVGVVLAKLECTARHAIVDGNLQLLHQCQQRRRVGRTSSKLLEQAQHSIQPLA